MTYLWKKSGGNIKPTLLARNSKLILPNVTPSDNGQYYCEAMNAGGITPSNTVSLDVKGNH